MVINLPGWAWALLIFCLIVLVGNVLHLWNFHAQFGF